MKSMNDLMLNYLQDIYYAEKQSVRGMARMAKAVEADEVKQAILEHRDQTQGQIERLERVFEMMGKRARGKKCAAMDGLAQEAEETAQEGEKGPVLDAAMIANAQAIEHYEIARYGAMVAWARQAGMGEAAELLQQTLQEEKDSDARLNQIAETSLNRQAAESGAEDEGAGEGGEERPRRGRRAAGSASSRGRGSKAGEQSGAQEGEQERPRRGRRAAVASAGEQSGAEGGQEEQRPRRGGRRAAAASSRTQSAATEKPARRTSARKTGGASESPRGRRSTRSK